MPSTRGSCSEHLSVWTFALVFILAFGAAAASAKEKVLYNFRGGSEGATPFGSLISDDTGNLYGTTNVGGGGPCQFGGCGTIFKLAPDGTETVLYAFTGGNDGAYPRAGLTSDGAGDYYGTTMWGGGCADNDACGTVFKLASDGTETVIYAFQGGSDGALLDAGVIIDGKGTLYGATTLGGNFNGAECQDAGCGTVYKVTPKGAKTTLYAFNGGNDGVQPIGGLIRDSGGNLYGTTGLGGSGTLCGSAGCGTVFKIASDGVESVLYAFKGGSDGAVPYAGVIADAAGNLYGTTSEGGTCVQTNCGTIFKLAPDGTETVLYSFQGGSDGRTPESALIRDHAGNLYGTTYYGGARCKAAGCGIVFKLAPDGTETVLSELGNLRGIKSAAGLLKDKHGILYGTATAGGTNNDGVVFSVKK